MYVIEENTVIPVAPICLVKNARVDDGRVKNIESVVADFYQCTVHDLDTFYQDSDAKIMCCFLLMHLLNYSIGSIAKQYNIDRLYLRKKIIALYTEALNDQKCMNKINLLKERINNITPAPELIY